MRMPDNPRHAKLTEGQLSALQSMLSGVNVVLTGDAGTGKSFVVDVFLEDCEKTGRQVLALAPTGVAALNLRGGSTIHRALGLKPTFLDPLEELGRPRKILKTAETVVIDEFSMCRRDLFERVVRMVMAAQRASGPKQIIVVGDPFQLPPVVTSDDESLLLERYGRSDGYCFLSSYWRALDFEPHILHEVIRQRDDSELSRQLSLARVGDAACLGYFNDHAYWDRDRIDDDVLWLVPTNAAADRINSDRLSGLPGSPCIFRADSAGKVNKGDKPVPDEVSLKAGARVMCVANEQGCDPDEGPRYVNGSMGTVLEASVSAIGRKPYARVMLDSGDIVEFEPHRWEISKSVLVEDGKDPETGVMKSHVDSEVIGVYTQIPLRLAWAVTIHKAQGKTYDRIAVDTRVFEKSQLYVALSRVTSFDGLFLYPKIARDRLRADDEVCRFYDGLVAKERLLASLSDADAVLLEPWDATPDGFEHIAVPHDRLHDVLGALQMYGLDVRSPSGEPVSGEGQGTT